MRIKFVIPLLMLALAVSSCGGGGGESSSSSETSSEDSSTTISYYDPPVFDGEGLYIHYQRNDTRYDDWALWIWTDNAEGAEYDFNGLDEYGAIAGYPLSTWGDVDETLKFGFIVKSKTPEGATSVDWSSKDISEDRFFTLADLMVDENNNYHMYLVTADSNIYISPDKEMLEKIESAQFINETRISIRANVNMTNVVIKENDDTIHEEALSGVKSYNYNLETPASILSSYSVTVTMESGKVVNSDISIRALYSTDSFNNEYYYDGDDLGATISTDKASTTFKVWSPVSNDIKLRIYESGTPASLIEYDETATDEYEEYTMNKGEKGVFSYTVDTNLAGKYYTYVVTNSTYSNFEIVDPYAKSAGVNGVRGMIVDFSLTNPTGWDDVTPIQYERTELAVYETHVVDITSSDTWGGDSDIAKTYVGAFEKGTTYSEGGETVKTGFDHIEELGVNAVQLLPIFDQANDEVNLAFNWGYNPLNYNVLEGSYSTNPFDGYQRIKEFKQLVQAYNSIGINIIMDVVYNHVNGAERSNFDVLMPGYYFRYTVDGSLSNGSGCGNETDSEMPMFSKFMADSTAFWASEYKLGGFRFDLMGLHDIDTMNELVADLKVINPNIVVYGEPWTGGTTTMQSNVQAIQANGRRFEGYGQFNDQIRDALIKGGMNSADSKGWVTNTERVDLGDTDKIDNGIRGITYNAREVYADKTVNYVTCHDNYTLYDRIQAAGISDEETIAKMAVLANSVVFTSLGTTFMLAGEEFLRTKGGNSNSYDASYEVNELDYSLKIQNDHVFENYQKLIEFKTSVDAMASIDRNSITVDIVDNVITYSVFDTDYEYKIVHVNGYQPNAISDVDFDGFELYLDTLSAYRTDTLVLSDATALMAYETIIARKAI